jgi:hypothetical protein
MSRDTRQARGHAGIIVPEWGGGRFHNGMYCSTTQLEVYKVKRRRNDEVFSQSALATDAAAATTTTESARGIHEPTNHSRFIVAPPPTL